MKDLSELSEQLNRIEEQQFEILQVLNEIEESNSDFKKALHDIKAQINRLLNRL